MNAFFRQNLEPMICTPVEISQRRFYGATGAVKGAPMLESLGLAQAFDFGGCRRPGIGRSVRKETKTLSGVHQKFLLYCEVERRLSPETVTSYRSDFRQFTEFFARSIAVGASESGRAGCALDGKREGLPILHGGAGVEHGDGAAAVGVAEPLWRVASEARPRKDKPAGGDGAAAQAPPAAPRGGLG